MSSTVKTTYNITVEDDELLVKTASKLESGRPLFLKRINDAEDTFEIGIYTEKDVLLCLLSYEESVGIAPFMDRGLIEVKARADWARLVKGSKKSLDKTELSLVAEYSYDEEDLTLFPGGTVGFIPSYDRLLAAFIYHVLSGAGDIVMDRPYLNFFTADISLEGRVSGLFDGAKRLECSVHTDDKFTKCKIYIKIYDKDNKEKGMELTEEEKDTALTFVNHALIFSGRDPINPEIEN